MTGQAGTPVDANGHLLDGADWRIQGAGATVHSVDADTVARAQETAFGNARSFGYFLDIGRCFYCGWDGILPVELAEGPLLRVTEPCPHVDGVRIEFDVPFPSGRVVVDDDLRDVFGDPHRDHPESLSLNYTPGQRAWSLTNAAIGVASGAVDDRSPDVYRRPDGTYLIATTGWSEDAGEIEPDGQKLATVCTDLWAYSLADYTDYLARGGTPEGDPDFPWTRTVIDVEPGVYHFTHHACERGFDPHSPDVVVFAEFRRSGPVQKP